MPTAPSGDFLAAYSTVLASTISETTNLIVNSLRRSRSY